MARTSVNLRLQQFRARLVSLLAWVSTGIVLAFLLADLIGVLAFPVEHVTLDLFMAAIFLLAGWTAHRFPALASRVFIAMSLLVLALLAFKVHEYPVSYQQLFFYGLVVTGSYITVGLEGGTLTTVVAIGLLVLLRPQVELVAGAKAYAYLFLFVGMNALPSAVLAWYMLDYFNMLAEEEAQLRRHALTDPLTGLLNRRGFLQQAEALFAAHRRTGTPLSVALIDLDRFKLINDEHGHAVGDAALEHVAEQMRRAFRRDSDLLGRLGGDELVVLMPGTDARTAARYMARLIDQLRLQPVQAGEATVVVTLSVGIAELAPQVDRSFSDLLRRADLALYEVKHKGRNSVAVAPVFRRSEARSLLHNHYFNGSRQA
ncbi:GGDEF domain-containing protein [Sulfurivirga sp.]|uniref:GGDEF domain-containing protein n=1 Tax=Sulfurivirga sp. TaxID=2614236 RepID=UPI0025FC2A57|nr:GGDEF domain-containing protein [Sulfurivirga sp.]